jgi:hypothetical protein
MRLRTLALVTVASGLALATAAYARPGGVVGGLGGGASGAVGGAIGGSAGGVNGHGGGGGGGGGGFGGSIGPALGGVERIGGGAPGLGGSVSGGGGGGGSFGGGLGPSLGGEHRMGGGAAGLGGSTSSALSGSLGPGVSSMSQGSSHASASGQGHADDRSVLGSMSTITTSAARHADTATNTAETDAADDSMARTHRMGPARASAQGVAHSNVNAGLRSATTPQTKLRAHGDAVANRAVNGEAWTRAHGERVAHTATNAEMRGRDEAATKANRTTSALAGLTTGLTVKTSSGTTLGTVSKVERSANGVVRTVLVRTANGEHRLLHLAPSSLSVSGDVVTTSQARLAAHG